MDIMKRWIPPGVRDCTALAVYALAGSYVTVKVIHIVVSGLRRRSVTARWDKTPKDVVIVHSLARGKLTPSPSPFVIKLETFLRMANIPYELDTKTPFGPTGKIPWITLNGEHMGDTQLIIRHLTQKFNVRLAKNVTEEQKAIAALVRIAVDEYIYWGGALWRYVHHKGEAMHLIFSEPKSSILIYFLKKYQYKTQQRNAWSQGIGRHNQRDVERMVCDALRAISVLLGNKKFLLGDEPCEEDAALFGGLSQRLWASPGPDSPYRTLLEDELHNLRDYCERMKSIFWPDWEDCIAKP